MSYHSLMASSSLMTIGRCDAALGVLPDLPADAAADVAVVLYQFPPTVRIYCQTREGHLGRTKTLGRVPMLKTPLNHSTLQHSFLDRCR